VQSNLYGEDVRESSFRWKPKFARVAHFSASKGKGARDGPRPLHRPPPNNKSPPRRIIRDANGALRKAGATAKAGWLTIRRMQVREAKDFLAQQAAEQAQLEGVPLSELEKRMMYFTSKNKGARDGPRPLHNG
jgi:hypothetical protein